MSSSGQGGPGDRKDEPKGLKKFMRRASLVLKPKSKRQSVSGPPASTSASASAPKDSSAAAESAPAAPTSPPTAVSEPSKGETAPTPSIPAQVTQTIKEDKPTPTPTKPRIAMSAKEASILQEEKARAMFAKYGLTLEPGEWVHPVTVGAPRIEKPVRMRIHRKCHRCQTIFGQDRICSNCQHTRCKKCPRHPVSTKSKGAKGKGAVAVDEGVTNPEGDPLTMPHRATGKEMSRKAPTQRVRRTCHECGTIFAGKAVQCENCKHMRCPQCPREPPKRDKYPEGYPGDEGVDPSQATSRRPKPGEEEATQSVEERMKRLDVSPQASAA
ncbi:hypothetical protein ACLMJK_003501 [Lecanora helva]